MFRRSPLLGAAVVYGASQSAARREGDRDEMRNADMQQDVERRMYEQEQRLRREQELQEQRQAERRERDKREDSEQLARTQRAVDDALAKERARMAQMNAPMFMNANMGGQHGMGMNPNVTMSPHMTMSPNIGIAPLPRSNPPSGIHPGAGQQVTGVKNRSACGRQCQRLDKFCGACGNKFF